MRIVLVSTMYPPDDGGGIGTYTRHLAESLAALGHSVRVICRAKGQERVDQMQGVEVHRFRYRYLPLIERHLPGVGWSLFLRKTLKHWQAEAPFDVVEFPNWEGPGFISAKFSRTFPVVTRLHTPYFESLSIAGKKTLPIADRFICFLEKKAVLASDKLTTSTRSHARTMTENYPVEERDIAIIPLGIELPHRTALLPPNDDGGKVKVLYVSRLEYRKGTLTLLQAIPALLQANPQVEITLIGQDRPHAPGQRLFKDYFQASHPEFTSRVHFLGYQTDAAVTKAYAECDVFVVPSNYESFGLIYVEAMMWGKPVIGGETGGIPEVIQAPETGFLIQPNDHEELTKKMVLLCADASLRKQMGIAARQRTEEKFDRNVMASITNREYERALEKFSMK